MDPTALKELVPDFLEKGAPLEGEVKKETVSFLTKNRQIKSPITPPPLNNHGNYVVSLSRLTEWLGQMVEENGVDIFPGFAGTEVLYEEDKVIGVRTGDKGIDPEGNKKANFEPGIDLQPDVVPGKTAAGQAVREDGQNHPEAQTGQAIGRNGGCRAGFFRRQVCGKRGPTAGGKGGK